jgi:hypothetical protein
VLVQAIPTDFDEARHETHDLIVSSCKGLPASVDLLLSDPIGKRLLTKHRSHVTALLCTAARHVLFRRGQGIVNHEISSTGT